jgi:hypothetical protein
MARHLEAICGNWDRSTTSPSDLPYAAEELTSWSECLVPAAIHEALTVALFTCEGRPVGFLMLLPSSDCSRFMAARSRLATLVPMLARGIDPIPCLRSTALLVPGATPGSFFATTAGPSLCPAWTVARCSWPTRPS